MSAGFRLVLGALLCVPALISLGMMAIMAAPFIDAVRRNDPGAEVVIFMLPAWAATWLLAFAASGMIRRALADRAGRPYVPILSWFGLVKWGFIISVGLGVVAGHIVGRT